MNRKNRRENIDPAETKQLNQLLQFSELRSIVNKGVNKAGTFSR
jgi:hypothetical protein